MSGVRIPPSKLAERRLVLLVVDLARTTSAVSRFEAAEFAEFINTFFSLCGRAINGQGGRIVTFLGDGCLSVFDEKRGLAAVDAVLDLREGVEKMREAFGVDVELGANVHQSVVAEAEFAPDDRYNVMGVGVIHAFRMGAGPGIRISEPVYRQLPSDRRSPWRKHKPPAVYTLDGDES